MSRHVVQSACCGAVMQEASDMVQIFSDPEEKGRESAQCQSKEQCDLGTAVNAMLNK